jgi:exodeoxyribonuclease VII small subunit
MKKANDIRFEDAIQRLETIVDELERGEITLDESVALFEEGIALSKRCSEKLDEVELRVQKWIKTEDGGFRLEPLQE